MPGTIIREKQQKLPRSASTDVGVLFLAGPAERGQTDQPEFIRNMAEFTTKLGGRTTNSLAYDMAEGYFGEGGSKLYFGRIVGPGAVAAARDLKAASNNTALRVVAKSPGEWGNSYSVAVVAGDTGGQFKIVVTGPNGYTDTSPSLADQAAALRHYATHDIVRVQAGGDSSNPEPVAAAALAGGTDDFANISDDTAAAALALFDHGLGPGQVAFAGRTSTTAWSQLIAHGVANNRVPMCDPPDTTSKSNLLANAATWRGLANSRRGGLFGPWLELPSLVYGGSGRAVPPSALVAGVMARNDARGLSPNKPSAGDLGMLQYATAPRAVFSDQDYEDLNAANINMIRFKGGDLKIYGYRTGASKQVDPINWQLGNARLYMAIAAKADVILERYVFKDIDGRGLIFKDLEGELRAMLNPYWEQGSLYGEDASDAYFVDTTTVNTPETIADGYICAALELTMSPMGETVVLDIIKRQIGA